MIAASKPKQLGLTTAPSGTWVQIERSAMEMLALLGASNPRAAAVMALLISQVGRNNAVVISQNALARMSCCSLPTLKRALSVLRKGNWLDVRQIGPTGTACAYIVNDRIVWSGPRDGIRYSLFSATVVLADDEQPDRPDLGAQPPLYRLPREGELQIPHGDGLPPPSQPFLAGLEPDLPATPALTEADEQERLGRHLDIEDLCR